MERMTEVPIWIWRAIGGFIAGLACLVMTGLALGSLWLMILTWGVMNTAKGVKKAGEGHKEVLERLEKIEKSAERIEESTAPLEE